MWVFPVSESLFSESLTSEFLVSEFPPSEFLVGFRHPLIRHPLDSPQSCKLHLQILLRKPFKHPDCFCPHSSSCPLLPSILPLCTSPSEPSIFLPLPPFPLTLSPISPPPPSPRSRSCFVSSLLVLACLLPMSRYPLALKGPPPAMGPGTSKVFPELFWSSTPNLPALLEWDCFGDT